MNQVVNIFILVLVISVLVGMTFLFTSALKNNVAQTTTTATGTFTNESGWINETTFTFAGASDLQATSFTITSAVNATAGDGTAIGSGNWTLSSTGSLTNASAATWSNVNFTGTYLYIPASSADAYLAINATENAGYTTTNYLGLLFLALIFGAVLIVVLRVMLPYINLGNQLGGGGF